MFTWQDQPDYHHRELDIELGRWGKATNMNSQFVVQPSTNPQNKKRFEMKQNYIETIYKIIWSKQSVEFSMYPSNSPDKPYSSWKYTNQAGIPVPGNENFRIDVWLNNGSPPQNKQSLEVVFKSFRFTP